MNADRRRPQLVLVGFGHVGRRLARLLKEVGPRLEAAYGLRPRIIGIATATHGCLFNGEGLDAIAAADLVERGGHLRQLAGPGDDHQEVVEDTVQLIDRVALLIDRAARSEPQTVVVETTPLDVVAGEPASSYIRQALTLGMDVVTANKGPVAHHYHELSALARRLDREWRFEATVMDGTPLFSLVERTLPAATIVGFRGVINSTTNAMLSEMERGLSAAEALDRMRASGIAEADPSLDVDGWDAATKTAAMMNVWLDARVTPRDITRRGIAGIDTTEVRRARASGRRIKLVATATRTSDGSSGRVEPESLDSSDPLYSLDDSANGLVIDTDLVGRLGVFQLDASLTHTAYGLLSDLVAVTRNKRMGSHPN